MPNNEIEVMMAEHTEFTITTCQDIPKVSPGPFLPVFMTANEQTWASRNDWLLMTEDIPCAQSPVGCLVYLHCSPKSSLPSSGFLDRSQASLAETENRSSTFSSQLSRLQGPDSAMHFIAA